MCNDILVKDPQKRISLHDILADGLVVMNAQKELPPDVFKAEFLEYGRGADADFNIPATFNGTTTQKNWALPDT